MSDKESPFRIESAQADDLTQCSQLDASYNTDYVWQMNFYDSEQTVQARFSEIRLPRTMTVEYPYPPEVLLSLFQQTDYVFVGWYYNQLIACFDGMVNLWQNTFTINNIIVQPDVRRKGIANLLLKTAKLVALQNQCNQLTITLQTKNYPGIKFAQKQGFVFCGYNDKYYPNGDIALIFSLKIES